ncbi:LuxR C-terminal-related transcriptional regulator [Inquilinus sp. YAF38]|uniref:helix-turn-helix transcriptional regulator n=1 Tax=Inquilinus sp. YAF38 TaxID=3233084 RepID=UPI003F8E2472
MERIEAPDAPWTADADLQAGIVDALGTPEFGPAVLHALGAMAGVEEIFAFRRTDDGTLPAVILSAGAGSQAGDRAEAYRRHYFRFDPLNTVFQAVDRASLCLRVRPDDIADRDYRRDCYARPGFVEKLSILRPGRGGWTTLSLFRHGGAFSTGEAQGLRAFGRLLLPLIEAHGRAFGADRPPPGSAAAVEVRLHGLCPALTGRERSVCARTLIGMTAEGIGLDLGIRPTSVLTYRRRAYERLGISTALQLAARLFH